VPDHDLSLLAWHFLRDDQRMQYLPFTPVKAGQTYTAEGPLMLCENGLHGSVQAIDALQHAPGSIICRVRLSEERINEGDKSCARSRTVLWLANAALVLHEFTCCLAELAVLRAVASGYTTDERSAAVIAARRTLLQREHGIPALVAARGDALDGVWEAVGQSPWEVPGRLAVTRIADWMETGDSAWAAGRVACRAARDIIGMTAGYTARETAWITMNVGLERMLRTLAPHEGDER
jgi:hypothetical protein